MPVEEVKMGNRNYRHHEPKKPKKGQDEPLREASTLLPVNPEVEVIGKKGKRRREED